MHILVATSGVLSPALAVEFVGRLLEEGDEVTVTTVIEVPRTFLDDLRSERWHPLQHGSEPVWTSANDAVVDRYVEERGRRICEPVVRAMTAAGLTTHAEYLEGEDPAATISGLANKLGVDMVVMGATRPIFDQSAWESVSARVTLECNKPVLVLPPPSRSPVGVNDNDED